jgi:hypothetical protein
MPRRQRLVVYGICIALWASGLLWLLLDVFFERRGEFGWVPHPLQPPILLLHGVLAIVSLYVLGWVSSHHALRWWSEGSRRSSGGAFLALSLVLTVSGFALFFLVDDDWRRAAKLTHEVVGVLVTLIALQHWAIRRRARTFTERPHRYHHTSPRHMHGERAGAALESTSSASRK